MCRSCAPISGSHQHGPPLLGRVRTPPRSPTSTLLCRPPTPSSPSAAAPVVPRQRPTPVRRACSSPSHRRLRLPVQRRRHFYPGSPLAGSLPRRNEGLPGAWAIPFRACRSPRPRRVRCAPRPVTVRSPSPSGPARPSAPGMHSLSRLSTHGPLARVPTLRRIRYRPRRKARYRPGGLTLGRAGVAPAG